MNRLEYVRHLWRYFGPEWLAYRLKYVLALRTGWLRYQMPPIDWSAQPLRQWLDDPLLASPQAYLDRRLGQSPKFFFAPSDRHLFQPHFASWDNGETTPLHWADQIARGEFRYFERTTAYVGFPPDWHLNPLNGQCAPDDRHWSQISDSAYGDIKVIWEPSRFAFTYPLVRAYWRTGDDRYAEVFWRLVEDWRVHNPPQQGANWKCGQEISFRVMAWCFGLYGFLDSPVTTVERVALLAQMVAVSGQRIEANLDYALSQHNNHGISEGMGLWTIGVLFPELRAASRWRERGRDILETLGRELIYDDGAFVQHSVNYHRLMLHDYLWCLRLADLNNQPFSDELRERVRWACNWLYQIQDGPTGQVPYYGQNDGALILPLSNCDYRDFRPVVQAAYYLCTGMRCYDDGPWGEDLLWLFGLDAIRAPVQKPSHANLEAEVGGYYTLRAPHGFAFTRCAAFRHRPGQADMLHIDLWWRGQNIALDAGTFSYNSLPPWNNPLAQAAYHNVVTVDGLDQMERAGRFLWLPWLRGQVRHQARSALGHLAYWEGEHDGYQRLKPPVRCRRAIMQLGEESWAICDRLTSSGGHDYRLHWLFPDLPYAWDEGTGCLALHTPQGNYYVQALALPQGGRYSLVRADERSPRGWRAPYYNYREPAISVDITTRSRWCTFLTILSPNQFGVHNSETTLSVTTEQWQATLNLSVGEQDPLVSSVVWSGVGQDRLAVA